MFRKRDNENVPMASAHSTGSGVGYPPLEEKHKKVSLRNSSIDVAFNDEEKVVPERFEQLAHQRLIKALSNQAYHLPGYTYWEDWRQYFGNNHPMFGICFHHKLHPIGWGMRGLCFLASIVFGLVITNIVWLWAEGMEDNSALVSFDMGHAGQVGSNFTQYLVDINDQNQVEVTKDMIVLWTLGGALHGLFDNTIWTLTICSCCDPGEKYEYLRKYKRFGTGILSFAILLIAGVATLSVVLRAALENEDEVKYQELRSAGLFDDAVSFKGQNKESYEFLMSFGIEIAIALLFHFPVIGFILFSGCLNIRGKIPVLGGRPYEVLREEEELAEINGTIDPETLQPVQRTTASMTMKERSRLINSGVREKDDKGGKIAGMAKFWDSKIDDSGTKSKGSSVASGPSSSSFSDSQGSWRSSNGSSIPAETRRSSDGSSVSPTSPPAERRNSFASTQSGSYGGDRQRRDSMGSSRSSQAPGSPTRGSRRIYIPPGARAYTGGRVYVPRTQGGPGRGSSHSVGPSSYPRGRPQSASHSGPHATSPGADAYYPPRSPRPLSPTRSPQPIGQHPTAPGSPSHHGGRVYPQNTGAGQTT